MSEHEYRQIRAIFNSIGYAICIPWIITATLLMLELKEKLPEGTIFLDADGMILSEWAIVFRILLIHVVAFVVLGFLLIPHGVLIIKCARYYSSRLNKDDLRRVSDGIFKKYWHCGFVFDRLDRIIEEKASEEENVSE